MNQNARPWYFWPLIAFVVGLLIGWLVIGWALWPVTWTNAQMRDLRPDLRLDYVSMVSESYAQTRNLEQARARLAGWSPEELAAVFDEAQTVLVARNPQAAQSAQELAVALGATGASTETGAQPQPQATAPAQGAAPGQAPELRQVCTAALFILIAAGALALLVFLFRRWRATQDSAPLAVAPLDFDDSEPATAAEQEKSYWPVREVPVEEPGGTRGGYSAPPVRPYMEPDDAAAAATVANQPPLRPVPTAGVPKADTQPPAAPQVKPTASTPGKLVATEEATYQMGEPDYDEAFDINDSEYGFMGQFGLQLIEPFGRERDQAVALQVWLWDSSDPDTQAKVLMSEGAYRDTALRSQHAGEHVVVPVRPGAQFELESHELLLKGRVEKVTYAEAEPPRGVFAELKVKMSVSRKV